MTEPEIRKNCEELVPQVRLLARMAAAGNPRVGFDEFFAVGCAALVEVLAKFESGRGLKAWTFARWRVWGAMMDEARAKPRTRRGKRPVRVVQLRDDEDRREGNREKLGQQLGGRRRWLGSLRRTWLPNGT